MIDSFYSNQPKPGPGPVNPIHNYFDNNASLYHHSTPEATNRLNYGKNLKSSHATIF